MPQTALRDARTHLTLALERLAEFGPVDKHPAGRRVRSALASIDAAERRLRRGDLALAQVADGSVGYCVDDLPVLEAITHPSAPVLVDSWDDDALRARIAAAGSGADTPLRVAVQAAPCKGGGGDRGGCGCQGGCAGCGGSLDDRAADSERLLRVLASAPAGGHLAA